MVTKLIYGKRPLKYLLLQNLKAGDNWTWSHVCRTYQVCSHDGPKLTSTYLTSRSNFLPNTVMGRYLKTGEAKFIINAGCVEWHETVTKIHVSIKGQD